MRLVFAVALFCCVQAFGLPFSHQAHLKLKLTCVACHASAQTSVRVEDNNLPQKAVCLGCHKEASIKRPAATLVSRFSHKQHVTFGSAAPIIRAAIETKTYLSPPGDALRFLSGGNTCTACHRGLEESVAVTKAAFPQMADCLVCHSKIDPPFSCETCHSKEVKLKPANHTQDFLDAHHDKNAKLDRTTCAVCHGRKFSCQGCH